MQWNRRCVWASVRVCLCWVTDSCNWRVEQVWASPSEPVGPDMWLCRAPIVAVTASTYSDSFPAQGCKLRHCNFDGPALMVGCRCWWQNFLLYLKGVDRCEMRTQKDTHPHQHTLRPSRDEMPTRKCWKNIASLKTLCPEDASCLFTLAASQLWKWQLI